MNRILMWPLRTDLVRYRDAWQQRLPVRDQRHFQHLCVQDFERKRPQVEALLQRMLSDMHQFLLESQR